MLIAFLIVQAIPYVLAVIMPNGRWLMVYALLGATWVGLNLYRLGPRGPSEGMAGNVFGIPEPQELFVAEGLCLAFGVLLRGLTVYFRERRLPFYAMTLLHIGGLPFVMFSIDLARHLGRLLGVNFG